MDPKTTEKTELEKLEEQILAEKAKAAATKSATDSAFAVAKKRAELEAAQRETEAQRVIAKFTSELGPKGIKWDAFDTEGGLVVIGRPSRTRYNEWLKKENQTDPDAMMAFASTCVKHPSLQEFDAIITEQPAKLLAATAVANRLGGSNAKDIEGKS